MKAHSTNEAAAANAARHTAGAGNTAQLQCYPGARSVDNSPAALTLQRYQQMADESPQALQLKRYAKMAHGSSRTAVQQRLAGQGSGANMPAQLKTSVTWTEQKFEYNDASSKKVESEAVGKRMVADLDPADKLNFDGNNTSSKESPDLFDGLKKHWDPGGKLWVRGHLLNDHCHGPNTFPNIFPITGNANGDHLNQVESHIKEWLRLPTVGPSIRYEVDATQDSGSVSGLRNASGSFYCYAHMVDTNGTRHSISRTIRSLPKASLVTGASTSNASSAAPTYSSYTKHTNNWWYYNDKPASEKGNKSNTGLPVSKGMNAQDIAKWAKINKKQGWLGSYYQVKI